MAGARAIGAEMLEFGVKSWRTRARQALDAPRAPYVVSAVLTGVPRVWLALKDHSVFWPDEIYQSIEPAHRIAFGYGLISWEFRDGARSWLLPGVLAAIMKIVSFFSSRSLVIVTSVKLFMVALAIASTLAAVAFAHRSGGRWAAWLAGALVSTFPPLLVFSHRATPEMCSAPLLVLGAWMLLGAPRLAGQAGLAVGLAVALRMQAAPIAAVLCLDLVRSKRYDDALRFTMNVAWCFILGGALDWVTWGRPFNSTIEYMRFTLKGGSSTFGVQPPWYYLQVLWTASGPAMLVLVLGLLFSIRKIPGAVGAIVVFVGAHSVIPHKELRFIGPIMPLACAAAAVGLTRALRALRAPRRNWQGLLAGLAGAGAVQSVGLTNADLGMYIGLPYARESVWRFGENASLLIAAAGRKPDLCGLLTLGLRAGFTGGFSYLHREVPLLYRHQLCGETTSANYLIARRGKAVPPEYRRVDGRGDLDLFKRPGTCEPPEHYDYMLEGATDMGIHRSAIEQPDPSELKISAGTSGAAFTRGWSTGEILGCRKVRWAIEKTAEIEFPLEPTGSAYTLSLSAQSHKAALPQAAQLSLNGKPLGRYLLSDGWTGFQTVVPPTRLERGRNLLRFDFARVARADASDQRELAALFDQVSLIPVESTADIDVGTSAGRSYLALGFSGDERSGRRTCAWSQGPRSRVNLTLPGDGQPYVLQVLAYAYAPVAPNVVRVRVNESEIGSLSIPARWSHRAVVLPSQAVRPGANTIEFEYGAVRRPQDEDPQSRDNRELAVMYDQILVTPVPNETKLDLGTDPARIHEIDGFSSDEMVEHRSAIWSDGSVSRLILGGEATTSTRYLSFELRAFKPISPVHVEVFVNDKNVGYIEPDNQWRTLGVSIPGGTLRNELNVVELRYAHTARPIDMESGSKDARQLAVQLDSVELTDAAPKANAEENEEEEGVRH